jgi:hypothetical protein
MATQLLIYEAAVPVSASRHANWSAEVGTDYSFSKSINSVPLTAVEFPAAVSDYAIVFAGSEEVVMPAAILGMREAQNLYLGEDGTWQAQYVPAFLRRYPFVFSSADEGRTFALCVDETYAGFNQEGRGERLFGDDRKPTPWVENVLKFLQQYQVEFQRTQAFCRKLKELNLLEPMQAQLSLRSGERMSLRGFMAVSRSRLKTLSADKLADLVRADEIELIYLHLQSMRNFNQMRERVAGQGEGAAAQTPPTAGEAPGEPEREGRRPAKDKDASARRK